MGQNRSFFLKTAVLSVGLVLAFWAVAIFKDQPRSVSAIGCPFSSTQARVQRNNSDPWNTTTTVNQNQPVYLGGFHNGTGRFAGDNVNTYSPNSADVEFVITDPQGRMQTVNGQYPVTFTPTQVGTYFFTGKTRVPNTGAGTYYAEAGCTDSGSITVTQAQTQVQTQTVNCPYTSTQVRVQKNSSDPWNSSSLVAVGQSISIGGFHNATGRFAGDPVNPYNPNTQNVEFLVIDPSGASRTLSGSYPVSFTPTMQGTYTVIGRTKIAGQNSFYTESSCNDAAAFTVSATQVTNPTPTPTVNLQPSSSPNPTVSPNPTPTALPTASPQVSVSPQASPTPTSSPVVSATTNIAPFCLSLIANPAQGGATLTTGLLGKGRDSDGIIKRMEFDFGDGQQQGVDTNGETNRESMVLVSHTYQNPGVYYATLRVKDNSGQSNEWSPAVEGCKVKIEVQGQILGASTQTTQLPKAGVTEVVTVGSLFAGIGGVGLQIFSRKLRQVI
jgi:hypothetical protein